MLLITGYMGMTQLTSSDVCGPKFANLWELALHSDLSQDPQNNQKAVVVTLLKECRDAVYGFNPLTPQVQPPSSAAPYFSSAAAYPSAAQPANQAFAQPVMLTPTSSSRSVRVVSASTQSQIESNAKAALGTLAYLNDPNLFGQQGQSLYTFLQYRLQQAIALMEGSVTLEDVASERQRLITQQQVQGQQGVQSGSYLPGAPTTAPTSNTPNFVPTTDIPSPVAGLEPKAQSWEGTPNTDANGQETVGSRQDWFSVYGTTLAQFAARCSRWMRGSGSNQAMLMTHLRQNGVPDNIIAQTMPYVNPS